MEVAVAVGIKTGKKGAATAEIFQDLLIKYINKNPLTSYLEVVLMQARIFLLGRSEEKPRE